jgi:flagellar biosynthesis/type III secretory pathway protein FliH
MFDMKSSTAVSETSWLAGPADSSPTRPSWMAPSSRRVPQDSQDEDDNVSWVRPSQAPAASSPCAEVEIPPAPKVPLVSVEAEAALPPPPTMSQEALDEVIAQKASELESRDQTILSQQQQLTELQTQLNTSLKAMASLRENLVRESEGDLVKLALAMAKKLVGEELDRSPQLIATWAKEALGRLAEHEDLELCIAPDLAKAISPELWFATTGVTPVVDSTLDAENCMVRWPDGHVNVSREARVKALEQSLQPLLLSTGKR